MSARPLVLLLALLVLIPRAAPGIPPEEVDEATVRRLVAAEDRGALGALGPGVMPVLARLYEASGSDPEQRARLAAIFYGLGFESEEARQAMWPDLDTDDETLRLRVQWALGRVSGDDAVVDALFDRMLRDPNPLFREKAACGLAHDQIHLDPEQRKQLLSRVVELLESDDRVVRGWAIRILFAHTGQTKGFAAVAPPAVRAAAVKRWRRWVDGYGQRAAARSLPPLPRDTVAEEPVFRPLTALTFDDGPEASGPDTFRVWARARGSVERTPLYRWSGGYSVEIRDVPEDGDFPELLGTFDPRHHGEVFFHFAFLVTNPFEPYNMALAGPAGFRLGKDGVAFWLQGREGGLLEISDSRPEPLLPVEPFTWYLVDVRYRIDAGRYDLAIYREGGEEPAVSRKNAVNASGQPGSAVDKLSFIGDVGSDRSAVVYYVDDVVVAAGDAVEVPPLVAPGRRKLFVEMFGAPRRLAEGQLLCLPALVSADLGTTPTRLQALPEAARDQITTLVGDPGRQLPTAPATGARLVDALRRWRQGCGDLARGRPDRGLSLLREATVLAPEARIVRLAAILAMARGGEVREAEEQLSREAASWGEDPRFAVAAAMLAAAAGDLDAALAWLRQPVAGLLTEEVPRDLPRLQGDDLHPPALVRGLTRALVADQQYFLEAESGRFSEAGRFALRMATLEPASRSEWLERAGDAALLAGDAAGALAGYAAVEEASGSSLALVLKRADAYFLLGDLAAERRLRESVYGSLEP